MNCYFIDRIININQFRLIDINKIKLNRFKDILFKFQSYNEIPIPIDMYNNLQKYNANRMELILIYNYLFKKYDKDDDTYSD